MDFDFDEAKVTPDGFFCLKVKNLPMARQFVLSMKKRAYMCSVKECHKKRSLNANAYMWLLCEKLSQAIGSTKEDVYRESIKNVGVWKDFELNTNDATTLCKAWQMLGAGWITEQIDYAPDGQKVIVRAYYGSSQYNTKQMSRLIDNIVQDCKAVGIETMTPAELERLKSDWRSNEK